ncbi:hypothetical protein BE08_26375 [Sorangium cellulosum]|uniref:Uncharacterized protein n=1 Tax=Sorangium cellulosum TaxID=56 RepID=A0A150PC23_SORCE|nr:hypothetical protein BE08_26375 [Sorangium cellulosum]
MGPFPRRPPAQHPLPLALPAASRGDSLVALTGGARTGHETSMPLAPLAPLRLLFLLLISSRL